MLQPATPRPSAAEQFAKIAQGETLCEQKAADDTNAEVAQIAASGDTLPEVEIRQAEANSVREIAACRADADRLNAKIARREIAEYQNQAQEDRQRGALIATLTGSRIH